MCPTGSSGFPRLHPSFPVKGQLDWVWLFWNKDSVQVREGVTASGGSKRGGCEGRPVVESILDHCRGMPKMHVTARAVQDQFDEARMEFEDLIAQ